MRLAWSSIARIFCCTVRADHVIRKGPVLWRYPCTTRLYSPQWMSKGRSTRISSVVRFLSSRGTSSGWGTVYTPFPHLHLRSRGEGVLVRNEGSSFSNARCPHFGQNDQLFSIHQVRRSLASGVFIRDGPSGNLSKLLRLILLTLHYPYSFIRTVHTFQPINRPCLQYKQILLKTTYFGAVPNIITSRLSQVRRILAIFKAGFL